MATPAQTLLFTALPAGHALTADGKPGLRISVLVSARLSPPAGKERLDQFPDLLKWPARAERIAFDVIVDGSVRAQAKPDYSRDPLEPKLWPRLFREDTFVRGHAFTDLEPRIVRGFPATAVYEFIRELYETLALNHGAEPPPAGSSGPYVGLLQDVAPIRGGRLDPANPKESKHEEILKKNHAIPPDATPASLGFANARQQAFYTATRFYTRPENRANNPYLERPKPELAPARPKKPTLDFHECLAALADYPRLMRRLGLVIDLVVPRDALPKTGFLSVKPIYDAPLAAFHKASPAARTRYLWDATTFLAASGDPKTSELQAGYLDLREADDPAPAKQKEKKTPPPYALSQLEIDGSALKTVDFAGNLQRQLSPSVRNYATPDAVTAPALRSGGLALLRRQRDWALRQRFVRSKQLQADHGGGAASDLFAEDVLRGHRVDIWDDHTKAWHPLCARAGRYHFERGGDKFQLDLDDEGYVKAASVSQAPKDSGQPDDLYAHERVVEFDGWSLAAPRPGKVLPADPAETEPATAAPTIETEFGLAARFRAPKGSLPRLRFGWSYRLRVRWVDLAGNSVDFDPKDDTYASAKVAFRRFEPVGSPALQLRERVTEGESLEHLVIRSDFDRDAATYAADPAVDAYLHKVRTRLGLSADKAPDYAYRAENERHLAPPKVAQQLAEQHGRFDKFIGKGADHAAGFRLAARESGTFLSRTIVNLATGAEEPIPGLELEVIPPTGVPTPTDLDDPKRAPGDALQQGEYILHREEQLIVPYLPDPLAVGIAFHGLPGTPAGKITRVFFEGEWPNLVPFRLRIVERPGTVADCTQTFSHDGKPITPTPENNVLTVFLPKGTVARVRYASIYARDEGASTLALIGWLEARGAYRGALRALAESGGHWMLTPWRTLTLVHAVQRPLCAPTFKILDAGRNLGDTFATLRGAIHLNVATTAQLDLLAAWSEPIDDLARPAPHDLARSAHVYDLPVQTSYADPLKIPVPGHPGRHEFGDTKHRLVDYRVKGTTRFREYFPPELFRDEVNITRVGDAFQIHVPSSARPAAPAPLYVLPTFRWRETPLAGGEGLVRVRAGGGLRVYLDRPWWSSGADERLGAVFTTQPITNANRPYATQWGLDPLFDSDAPAKGPTLAAFRRRTEGKSGVSLAELGDANRTFSVAGHAVEYDATRRLWFSDLEIAAGSSYFPFIRLALARFQPYSIPDAELSRVVQTDFVQLVPDRTLDLRWTGPRTLRVTIYGEAPAATHLSRLFLPYLKSQKTTAARAKSAPAPADIMPRNLSTTEVLQAFQPGEFSRIERADVFKVDPSLLQTKAEPAEPSAAPGLNEYSAVVETLDDGDSPDFEWKPLTGVTLTKPRKPLRLLAKRDFAASAAPVTKPAATAKAARAKRVARGVELSVEKRPDLTAGPVSKVPDFEITDRLPELIRNKLWEADVNLPAGPLPARLRIVCREHELYVKATPGENDVLPIARRLVYADIAPLVTRGT